VLYTESQRADHADASQYSVSGIGLPAGGSVTLVGTPIAIGTKAHHRANGAVYQDTVLSNQGAYFPEVVESRFDRVYMAFQQIVDRFSRALVVPISDS